MNIRFMWAHAWLDEDGKHVWLAHRCVDLDGTDIEVETILPWPTWRAENGLEVFPSVSCSRCDLHSFLRIEPEPMVV